MHEPNTKLPVFPDFLTAILPIPGAMTHRPIASSPPFSSERTVRILHIIASMDPASGGPVEAILKQDLASTGHASRVVATLDAPGSAFLSSMPVKVIPLGRAKPATKNPVRRLFDRYGYSPYLVPWLNEHADEFDAIIVDGLWHYASFAASRVLPKGRVPYFVFPHGMLDPWFSKNNWRKHLLKQAFWTIADGRLLASARSVFFTADEEKRRATGVFFGHQYESTIVPFGTAPPPPFKDAHRIAFENAVPAATGRRYLLFFGRIHRKKGVDLLVRAFAIISKAYPDFDLVVAGPDATGWCSELNALASSLGCADRIHWPGALYDDAKWGAIYGADAFCLPSHQENFGIAVAEALGCGTPALISDKVNIWREIDEASAGIVRSDTLEGTVQALNSWLSLSSLEQASMRKSAKSVFSQRFNVEVAAPALLENIKELLVTR